MVILEVLKKLLIKVTWQRLNHLNLRPKSQKKILPENMLSICKINSLLHFYRCIFYSPYIPGFIQQFTNSSTIFLKTKMMYVYVSCKIADDDVAYLLSDLQLNYLFRVKLQFYQHMFNQKYVL